MKKPVAKIVWVSGLASALFLTHPILANADTDSDLWNKRQAELQKALQPGDAPAAYQAKIKELGYQITSVNYNDEDYLEYELVKDKQT